VPDDAPHETAASNMVTRIPQVRADATVATVIESLQAREFDCIDVIFVTDADEKLTGMLRIKDLFANGKRLVGDIMETEFETACADDDQEAIAVSALQQNMIAVPVVDADGRLLGVVPPQALFKIFREEHMEDLQRLAGISPRENGPDMALNAPLYDRFRRRLPWLIFGLFASSLVTLQMVQYENELSANVTVAFFVPALVYIAGAIGAQAVSVAVRGLSVNDIPIGRLISDELLVGFGLGAVLGLITFEMVAFTFDDYALAFAIGLAVLAAGTLSATVGFGLPWIFKYFGYDPALGSGPICTIVQDLASLSIYFGLVSVLIL
jgi:magnesium transporter